MSARPESGPNANRYVCVPSPMVAKPSPPEICWHLIAPFTFAVGTRNPALLADLQPLFTEQVSVVTPVYAGSELLLTGKFGCVLSLTGWVTVLVGHCTPNDCALAATVAKQTRSMGNQT